MATPLSRVIQSRINHLGITRDELAERSGLGRSTIYAFIGGTRTNPHGDTLRKLARGLEMTPGELLKKIDGEPHRPAHADERIARIVDMLPSVPRDLLSTIESVITMAATQLHAKSRPNDQPAATTISSTGAAVVSDLKDGRNGENHGDPPHLANPKRGSRDFVAAAVMGITRVTVPVSAIGR